MPIRGIRRGRKRTKVRIIIVLQCVVMRVRPSMFGRRVSTVIIHTTDVGGIAYEAAPVAGGHIQIFVHSHRLH